MRTLTAIAATFLILASTAFAGPLKTSQVAGDANWVAHLDIAEMLDSGLGKFILAEAQKNPDFVFQAAELREGFGFDITRDVRGITLYGPAVGQKDGVVVIDITVDQGKVIELLSQNETYKTVKYGAHVVHIWTDPPKTGPRGETIPSKTHYGTFHGNNTAVAASKLDLLKKALDVLDGEGQSLAESKALPMLPKPVAGEFMVAAGNGVPLPPAPHPGPGGPDRPEPHEMVLRNASLMSFQAGEDDEGTFATLVAEADNAKKANQIRNVVRGLTALVQMSLADREDLPLLNEKVTVAGEGTEVRVSLSAPTKSLIDMIEALRERREAARAKAALEAEGRPMPGRR